MSQRVSIHARQFHSGRPSSFPSCMTGDSFNPRPPISQRATPAGAVLADRGIVSIHARQFHSGRPARIATGQRPVGVSIHARQFHSGRLGPPPADRPRPGVSIHARQFHSGRPARPASSACWPMFQSTFANFTAGDLPRKQAARAPSGFNPRPPISQRATIHDCSIPDHVPGFNPRPPISQRATT